MPTILHIALENAAVATALACLVAALAWPLRGRPAVRHALWLLVLLKLLTPPVWGVAMPELPGFTSEPEPAPIAELPEVVTDNTLSMALEAMPTLLVDEVLVPAEPIVALETGTDEFLPVAPGRDSAGGTSPIAAGVWVLGSAATLLVSIVRLRRFGRVLDEAEHAPDEVVRLVGKIRGLIGLRRLVEIRTVPGGIAPLGLVVRAAADADLAGGSLVEAR